MKFMHLAAASAFLASAGAANATNFITTLPYSTTHNFYAAASNLTYLYDFKLPTNKSFSAVVTTTGGTSATMSLYTLTPSGHATAVAGQQNTTHIVANFLANQIYQIRVFTSTIVNTTNRLKGTFVLNAVPLPAALPLFGAGIASLVAFGRRKARQSTNASV